MALIPHVLSPEIHAPGTEAAVRRGASTLAAVLGAAFCASNTTEIDLAGVLRTANAQTARRGTGETRRVSPRRP
jgi:hypothetical protein